MKAEAVHSVSIVGPAPPLRGVSSYCLELARNLSRRVPVRMISFKALYPDLVYPGGTSGGDMTFPSIESETLTIDRRLAWYSPLGWRDTARSVNSDLVHLHHWSLPIAPVLSVLLRELNRRGVPTVMTLHNVAPHRRSTLFDLMTRHLARRAGRCIVHSAHNRIHAVEHLGLRPERLHVIPHGPLNFFKEDSEGASESRTRLGIAPEEEVVLFFGAIRPYKGLDVLLSAVARVAATRPRLRLLIAGQCWGSWRPYETRLAELGLTDRTIARPHYIPANEVCRYFRAADVVALPYTHFGAASGVAMTAAAFGKPLVVTRVADFASLVSDPACIAAPTDDAELASAIEYVLSDRPRRERLAAASTSIAERYSWDGIIDATLACYTEAADPEERQVDTHGAMTGGTCA